MLWVFSLSLFLGLALRSLIEQFFYRLTPKKEWASRSLCGKSKKAILGVRMFDFPSPRERFNRERPNQRKSETVWEMAVLSV